MAKWARRARKAGIKPKDLFIAELPRVKDEAATSAEDLLFAFQTEGVGIREAPDYSVEGLLTVEGLYRKHYKDLKEPEVIERLMALFLGQVVVIQHGGSWAIYPGRYHVYSPLVVQLKDQSKYIEPFLYCTELAKATGFVRARQGDSLAHIFLNLETYVTP